MKNNNLIDSLAKDLTPWKKMDSLQLFSVKWLGFSFLLFSINYFWMPLRIDLPEMMKHDFFHVENIFWVILAITSSIALYKSSFPDNTDKKYSYIAYLSMAVLFALAFRGDTQPLSELIPLEFELWRGGCGLIISFFTVLQTPVLGHWARKGAPVNPGMTGMWAALSASSVGCLLMQFICTHHTSAHLVLWHFIPLSITCAGSYFLANKFLRW